MDFFSLGIFTLMAAMSPGPDFAVVSQFAIVGNRKEALLASLGIASALSMHVLIAYLGFASLLKYTLFFSILQISGCLYLGYLGIKILKTSFLPENEKNSLNKGFKAGFLTNLLNPKPSLFFVSIFSQVGFFKANLWDAFLGGVCILSITLFWFISFTLFITQNSFKKNLPYFQKGILKILGIALLGFSLYMLFNCLDKI